MSNKFDFKDYNQKSTEKIKISNIKNGGLLGIKNNDIIDCYGFEISADHGYTQLKRAIILPNEGTEWCRLNSVSGDSLYACLFPDEYEKM